MNPQDNIFVELSNGDYDLRDELHLFDNVNNWAVEEHKGPTDPNLKVKKPKATRQIKPKRQRSGFHASTTPGTSLVDHNYFANPDMKRNQPQPSTSAAATRKDSGNESENSNGSAGVNIVPPEDEEDFDVIVKNALEECIREDPRLDRFLDEIYRLILQEGLTVPPPRPSSGSGSDSSGICCLTPSPVDPGFVVPLPQKSGTYSSTPASIPPPAQRQPSIIPLQRNGYGARPVNGQLVSLLKTNHGVQRNGQFPRPVPPMSPLCFPPSQSANWGQQQSGGYQPPVLPYPVPINGQPGLPQAKLLLAQHLARRQQDQRVASSLTPQESFGATLGLQPVHTQVPQQVTSMPRAKAPRGRKPGSRGRGRPRKTPLPPFPLVDETASQESFFLFVRNLPADVDEQFIVNCFGHFGELSDVQLKTNPQIGNYALITYKDDRDAVKASSQPLLRVGDYVLYVKLQRCPKKTPHPVGQLT